MRKALLILPVAFLLATGASPAADGDVVRPRAGMWQVDVALVDLQVPDLADEELAQLREAALPQVESSRRICIADTIARVGDELVEGECRYTRIGDRGTSVDRALLCTKPSGDSYDMTITGTAGLAQYDYLVRVDESDTGVTAVTRETGRYLGACPN